MVERVSPAEAQVLARDEMTRAEEELKAARLLLDNGLHYKSVAASYYAVYHAAKSALLLKGVSPQSHEGLERMFSLYYVKTGEVEVDAGRIIGRLMKLREEADYYPEAVFGQKDSSETIDMAVRFVDDIRRTVARLFSGG